MCVVGVPSFPVSGEVESQCRNSRQQLLGELLGIFFSCLDVEGVTVFC